MADSKAYGYLMGAVAAASYGLNPTFALPLYADGMNPDSVLLLRYGMAIPIVALMALLRGCSLKIPARSILPLMGLGMLMALSSLTLFVSYNYMAAGIASTLLFVYPLMVAVIMSLFFREKLSLNKLMCILLAMGGIFLLYRTGDGGTLNPLGTLIVMASALSYAVYLVAINQKRLEGIASLTVTFWVLLSGSLLFVGRILLGPSPLTLPGRPALWLDAAALAILPTVVSLVCTTRAIQIVGSTPTAILGALEPVTAVVMGMLLFHETMTLRQLAGIAMILSAVSFVVAGVNLLPWRSSRS